ncbi:PREDICTED: uncharacterized protein LOC105570908, partial [Vollenhovia emeryi]|uniref:uncharacterized protein LOC105570908 n=1 Tax=Vollenhovia emeryi TaxID=411798 RepID=UPI0005F40B04
RLLLKRLEEEINGINNKGNDDESISKSVKSPITSDMIDSESHAQEMCQNIKSKGKCKSDQYCEDDDTLVIDNRLDVNRIQVHKVEGNCMVDPNFFLQEMHRTSFLNAKCAITKQAFGHTRKVGHEALNINTAITAGTITSGVAFAQLEEICVAANMPCLSEKTYIKHREIIIDDFQKIAMENMKMACEAEKRLALDRNEVINGVPYITVAADGSWMKRSYGTAYDSLSGIGAIIGYRTQKVLFVGIRNKFCTVCNIAERRGTKAKSHRCYKNFDRNASSTKMESDAIVEGFKNSIEMHGLIFRTVIADGDSNVYQSIIDNRPYRQQMVTVKKIECTNHLLRNLCKKTRRTDVCAKTA